MTGYRNRLVLLVLQYAPLLLFAVLFVVFGALSERFLTPDQLRQHPHPVDAYRDHRHRHDLRAAGRRHRPLGRRQHVCDAASLALYLSRLSPHRGLPGRRACWASHSGRQRLLHHPAARRRLHRHARHAFYRPRHRALFLRHQDGPLQQGHPDLRADRLFRHPLGDLDLRSSSSSIACHRLKLTTFGRQVYAVGADPDAAAKAGINVKRIVFAVYCICGVCAAIGGLVSASQVAVASSTFGFQKEFPVIAAAVLGGTSLFGGRGGVVGTVFGAVLIQTVENGLVMTNADPYLYPLVISVIIFIAVFIDSSRTTVLEQLERRKIRIEPG